MSRYKEAHESEDTIEAIEAKSNCLVRTQLITEPHTVKVLVIYDLVPEEQKRAIVDMTDEEFDFFSVAHNEYTNFTNDAEVISVLNVIGNAFCEDKALLKYCETDVDKKYFGEWVSDVGNMDISRVDKLICCGFIL